jgi:hypothetical protein
MRILGVYSFSHLLSSLYYIIHTVKQRALNIVGDEYLDAA